MHNSTPVGGFQFDIRGVTITGYCTEADSDGDGIPDECQPNTENDCADPLGNDGTCEVGVCSNDFSECMNNDDCKEGDDIPGTWVGPSGGTAESSGFSVSAEDGRVIGFSFTGSTIDANINGEILTTLYVTLTQNTRVCFDGQMENNNIIISDQTGSQINACPEKTQSSCLTICGDGICNFSELDECEQDCTE